MPVAAIMIPKDPDYRLAAFTEGLQRHGYSAQYNVTTRIDPEDVVVVWNRHGTNDLYAKAFEKAGAKVIVTENGFVGQDEKGHQLYAMARDHHNGAGRWYIGYRERWKYQGISLGEWRNNTSGHVLILPQRSIGCEGVAMPKGWGEAIREELRKRIDREVRLRVHPGKSKASPLPLDLVGAWCSVVWASSAGIKSILAGIPVYYDFPQWIGASAAMPLSEFRKTINRGDREPMLHRVGWAQWSLTEIAAGEPFEYLLAI